MPDRVATEFFTDASPRLLGSAYRILGSRADTEDAVQDTFLKWQRTDRRKIDNPSAWLTTICTRRYAQGGGARFHRPGAAAVLAAVAMGDR